MFWGGATETKASGKGPLGEFLVAFVGPATTLVLAGVFWFGESVSNGLVAATMGSLAGLSLIFAGFNALPGFPLDGGRMLLATVWGITGNRRTAMRAAGYGGIAVGAVIGGVAVWMVATGDIGMAVFLGYVAMILISAGRGMDQRIALRDQLVRGNGRRRDAAAAAHRADRHLAPAGARRVPARRPTARRSPSSTRGRSSARSRSRARARSAAAIRCGRCATACGRWPRPRWSPPSETLDDAVEWLGGREGLVLRDGVLVGALGPADIERWYRRVIEGKADDPHDANVPTRPDL